MAGASAGGASAGSKGGARGGRRTQFMFEGEIQGVHITKKLSTYYSDVKIFTDHMVYNIPVIGSKSLL